MRLKDVAKVNQRSLSDSVADDYEFQYIVLVVYLLKTALNSATQFRFGMRHLVLAALLRKGMSSFLRFAHTFAPLQTLIGMQKMLLLQQVLQSILPTITYLRVFSLTA